MAKNLNAEQSLLIVLGSCQVHYQILLIIFLTDFIILKVKTVRLIFNIYQLKIIN